MGAFSKFFGGGEVANNSVERQDKLSISEVKLKSKERGYPDSKLDPAYDIHDLKARQAMLDIISQLE